MTGFIYSKIFFIDCQQFIDVKFPITKLLHSYIANLFIDSI